MAFLRKVFTNASEGFSVNGTIALPHGGLGGDLRASAMDPKLPEFVTRSLSAHWQ